MVTAGEGLLKTRQTGARRIAVGSVILLRPGVWHRYKPDPETGWRESWIEMRGREVTDLLQSGTIPEGPLLRGSRLTSLLEELLETIHRRTVAEIPARRGDPPRRRHAGRTPCRIPRHAGYGKDAQGLILKLSPRLPERDRPLPLAVSHERPPLGSAPHFTSRRRSKRPTEFPPPCGKSSGVTVKKDCPAMPLGRDPVPNIG